MKNIQHQQIPVILNSNTYFFYTHRGPPKRSVGRAKICWISNVPIIVLIPKVIASLLVDITRSLYYDWLNSKADLLFKEKVSQYSVIIDVTPNRVIIKNLKNRWGSITKNKTVNLNVNLLKAPEDIIEYVIFHELCHLKIKGHSYQFWDYLKQFVPDYKQKVEWLKRNADSLLI
jgi:predicted metal-dependent hydrolase